jgi:biliverdin reductase
MGSCSMDQPRADRDAPSIRGDSALPLRWGVIGLGRVGRSSINALISAGPSLAHLKATASRRGDLKTVDPELWTAYAQSHPRALAPQEMTVSALIDAPDIDAVYLCTESALHASQAASALERGKYVLVHFPLCHSATEAIELFELAHQRGLILHQELIGSTSQRYLAWRQHCRHDPLTSWRCVFEGGLYRWIDDEVRAQRCAFLSLGRAHQAWGLAGPLRLIDARLTPLYPESSDLSKGYQLSIRALGRGDAQVELIERRAPHMKRAVHLEMETVSGVRLHLKPKPPQPRPLFYDDLLAFYRERDGAPAQISAEMMIDVIRWLESIGDVINRN